MAPLCSAYKKTGKIPISLSEFDSINRKEQLCLKHEAVKVLLICFQLARTDLIVLWSLVNGVINCDLDLGVATSSTRTP